MPRTGKSIHSLLASALTELEQQKRDLEVQIQALRGVLGKGAGKRGRPAGTENSGSRRGRMSAAARKRIAAAQKKRWAEYRKSAAGKGE